jgi:nucleotide-binding universal stress UspA family protein
MKILVPIEDILFGSAIADFIVAHAWPAGTVVKLLCVIEPFLLEQNQGHAPFSRLMELSGRQIVGAAHHTLDEVMKRIKRSHPELQVEKHVIEGPVKDEILRNASEWQADLIIAGSHGRSGFSRFFLGSVSLMLVSESPCPVLLIKPDAKTLEVWDKINTFDSDLKVEESTNNWHLQKILVALDDTAIADQVVNFVIAHHWTQPAQFKLLSVMRLPPFFERTQVELAAVHADRVSVRECVLRKLALKMRDYFHSPHIEEALLDGDPRKLIVESAEAWSADLIVLGSHYRDPAKRFALGACAINQMQQ